MKKNKFTILNSESIKSTSKIVGKLLSAVICLIVSWLACYPYLKNHFSLQILATILTALFFGWTLNNFQTKKHNFNRLEQFLWLLEYLGSKISAGHTLENSLINAADSLETQMGTHRDLYRALNRLRKNLDLHLDLDRSLQQFNMQFRCAYAENIIFLLSSLRIYGGQIEEFISRSRQMLQEQINIQKEIEAEQSQKYSEAAVLSVLPFCLAYILILGNRQYGEALVHVSWSLPAQIIIFALAVLAAVMTIRIMSPDTGTDANISHFINKVIVQEKIRSAVRSSSLSVNKERRLKIDEGLSKLAGLIKPYYVHLLPWSLGIRFTHQLYYLFPFREDPWICYLADKIKIGIYGLLFGLLFIFVRPIFWYILPVFIIVPMLYQDRKLFEKSQLHRQQERLHYPAWLNTLSLLLSSGLTLQRSLELSLSVWLKHTKILTANTLYVSKLFSSKNISDPFRLDLYLLNKQLENGVPAAKALAHLSEQSSVPQVQTALQLIIRYDSDGGNELLQLMQIQSAACWQVQKNALRKKLETRSLLLHLPMGLDLIAVLSTAILPAIASLQTSY